MKINLADALKSFYGESTIMAHSKFMERLGLMLVERNKMAIEVRIVDARSSYGRQEVLVRPTNGSGTAWVDAKRIELL
jgi:hypothetical protein